MSLYTCTGEWSTVQCECGPAPRKFVLTKLHCNSASHTENPAAKLGSVPLSGPVSAGLKPGELSPRVVGLT